MTLLNRHKCSVCKKPITRPQRRILCGNAACEKEHGRQRSRNWHRFYKEYGKPIRHCSECGRQVGWHRSKTCGDKKCTAARLQRMKIERRQRHVADRAKRFCKFCGQQMLSHRQKFCSTECYRASKGYRNLTGTSFSKHCIACNGAFQTSRLNQKTCGSALCIADYNNSRSRVGPFHRNCIICEQPFVTPLANELTCSALCSRERKQDRDRVRWPQIREQRRIYQNNLRRESLTIANTLIALGIIDKDQRPTSSSNASRRWNRQVSIAAVRAGLFDRKRKQQ